MTKETLRRLNEQAMRQSKLAQRTYVVTLAVNIILLAYMMHHNDFWVLWTIPITYIFAALYQIAVSTVLRGLV